MRAVTAAQAQQRVLRVGGKMALSQHDITPLINEMKRGSHHHLAIKNNTDIVKIAPLKNIYYS